MARTKAQGRMGKKKKTETTSLDPEQKETFSEGKEVEEVSKAVSGKEELLKQEGDAIQIKGL